jgi:hypothetical protein
MKQMSIRKRIETLQETIKEYRQNNFNNVLIKQLVAQLQDLVVRQAQERQATARFNTKLKEMCLKIEQETPAQQEPRTEEERKPYVYITFTEEYKEEQEEKKRQAIIQAQQYGKKMKKLNSARQIIAEEIRQNA